MRTIHMLATVPNTTAGTLREGKPYHIDDDLADGLVSGGYARETAVPDEPEAAVREPAENAARRTRRTRGTRGRRPASKSASADKASTDEGTEGAEGAEGGDDV